MSPSERPTKGDTVQIVSLPERLSLWTHLLDEHVVVTRIAEVDGCCRVFFAYPGDEDLEPWIEAEHVRLVEV